MSQLDRSPGERSSVGPTCDHGLALPRNCTKADVYLKITRCRLRHYYLLNLHLLDHLFKCGDDILFVRDRFASPVNLSELMSQFTVRTK